MVSEVEFKPTPPKMAWVCFDFYSEMEAIPAKAEYTQISEQYSHPNAVPTFLQSGSQSWPQTFPLKVSISLISSNKIKEISTVMEPFGYLRTYE